MCTGLQAGLDSQLSPKAAVKGPLRQDLFLVTLSLISRKVSSSSSCLRARISGLSSHRPLVNYHNSSHPEYLAFVQQLRHFIILP